MESYNFWAIPRFPDSVIFEAISWTNPSFMKSWDVDMVTGEQQLVAPEEMVDMIKA